MNDSGTTLALLRRQVALAGVALVAALVVFVAAANRTAGASAPSGAAVRQALFGDASSAAGSAASGVELRPGSVGRDRASIVRAIATAAPALGLDPAMELAVSLVETGGTLDPASSGDRNQTDPRAANGYCSFGLYQLNRCGGQGADYSPGELVDPATNIAIALAGHAAAIGRGDYESPAAAIVHGFQRPHGELVESYIQAISPGGSRYVQAVVLIEDLAL